MKTLVSLLLLFPTFAVASELKAIEANKSGISHLENKEPHMAEKNFLSALSEEPFHPVYRLNLGFTYEASVDPKKPDKTLFEKAVREYESVLRSKQLPAELEFVARFNAGNAAAGLAEVDRALKHYQAALEQTTDPERIQMVKNNIELLFMGGQSKGQGQGSGNSKSDDKDGQGEGDEDRPNPNNESDKNKEPRHFTQEEIKNILEELKAQEQKIRAMDYGNDKNKTQGPEKDW